MKKTTHTTSTSGPGPPTVHQSLELSSNGFKDLPVTLGDKHTTAEALSISPSTLKKYRLNAKFQLYEGIHYYKLNSRTIRYNLDLMVDWAIHRNDPHAHQRAIEAYLAKIAKTQAQSRKKKRT